MYSRSNGATTVTSNYPSSTGALHTETKVFDKYGRLQSISGVLSNSYDLHPLCSYLYDSYQYSTTMENYDRAQHGELSHSTSNIDGKDAFLSQTTDSVAGEVTKYGYNNGRLTAAVTYNTSNAVIRQETFVSDNIGRLTKDRFYYTAATTSNVTSDITYVKAATDPLADNRVSSYSYKVGSTEKAKTENTYDTYKRVTNKKYTVGGKAFTKSIAYDRTRVGTTTDSVGTTTTYQYDSTGRIASIDDGNIITYEYDAYGQIVRENNKPLDKTFVYVYDNNGNLTSAKTYAYVPKGTAISGTATKTETFTYGDTTHPDRLTKCGSTSINYNTMGCPTTYNDYTVTWSKGRISKLSKGLIRTGTHTYNYSYNAFGQRTARSYVYLPAPSSEVMIGELTRCDQTFYYDNSGRLVYEKRLNVYYNDGSETYTLVYLYDENNVIGVVYTASGTSSAFYFQRNMLGDVIGIYNTSGTKVAGYAYDAFGNCKITSSSHSIASRNPIRYRGYYYDEDTKLYYLNSRYYCPAWRRFISPDDTAYLDPETPNGVNLYAYCNNDPVNYADPSGHFGIFATILVSALVGAAIGGSINLGRQLIQNNFDFSEINLWEVGANTLTGAATGIAFGLGGVAGGIVRGGFHTLTIAGKALTVSQSIGLLLGTAAVANFAAGVSGYAMNTAGSETESFNILKSVSEGIGQTGKGLLSFFTGGMYVNAGFWNVGIGAKNTIASIIARAVSKFVVNFIPNYIFENIF